MLRPRPPFAAAIDRSTNSLAGPANQVVCIVAPGVYSPRSRSHRPVSRHNPQSFTARTIAARSASAAPGSPAPIRAYTPG